MCSRVHSWLSMVTMCASVLLLEGPQASEAAPNITSYVMVITATDYHFQLTFSEPVKSKTISAVTFHGYFYDYNCDPMFDNPCPTSGSTTCPASPSSILSPPNGIYSKYMTILLGTNERNCLFPSYPNRNYFYSPPISIGSDVAQSIDNVGSMAYGGAPVTYTYTDTMQNVAPTLTSFAYDVSSGVVRLSFDPNIIFTSLDTSALSFTNSSGMVTPLSPVSAMPDPADPYKAFYLTLPVETVVTLATSPWIGTDKTLLSVTVASGAIKNYFDTPFGVATTKMADILTRDCYNTSTYYDGTTGSCLPCDPACLACTGPNPFPNYPTYTLGCTQCSTVILNGSSYQCVRGTKCPDGYYKSNDTSSSPITTPGSILCLPCMSSCFTCTNETKCTSCVGLLPNQRPTRCCVNVTGGPSCSACNSSCLGGCRGPLNSDCVYCRNLNYTYNGTTYCLSSCPPHTYQRGALCLTCNSNVSDVLCPPDPCWLGFEYNRNTYKCQLNKQFRYIVIPATCGGGGLLVILSLFICMMCWYCPNFTPDTTNKRVYTNPTFSPESRSVVNPLLT